MTSVQTHIFAEDKPLDTYRDDLESEDFVGKVSKFEFLSHNPTSPTSSADKQRWALFEGLRFPSKAEQNSSSKGLTSKPPPVPNAGKCKQGPPTPPKPSSYQGLTPPLKVPSNQGPSIPPKPPSYQCLSISPVKMVHLAKSPSPVSFATSPTSSSTLSPISIKSPPSPSGSHQTNGRQTPTLSLKHSSVEDLAHCEAELQEQCQKMKEARLQDQELEKQERLRLQEILNMCADYERQLVVEKQQIIQQQSGKHSHTGIKTNGSLPRDTPPISVSMSSSDSISPTPDSSMQQFLRSTSSEDETNPGSSVFIDRFSNGQRIGSDSSDDSKIIPSRADPFIMTARTGIRTVASNHRNIDVVDARPVDRRFYIRNGNALSQTDSSSKQRDNYQDNAEKDKSKSITADHAQLSENDIFLSLTRNRTTRELSKKDQLKQLKSMKSETETVISKLRKQIKEMENQESEILTEYEMEKALLEGERQTQVSDLKDDENRLDAIKVQEEELMNDSAENQRIKNEDLIENSKSQLQLLQKNLTETRHKLEQCEEDELDIDETDRLKNILVRTQENIESEKKVFEDLEFQKLEHEAHREEERETLQHRLNIEKDIIHERIKLKKIQLKEIEMQQSSVTDLVRSDTTSIETKRQGLLEDFRKEKLKYVAILKRIMELVETHNVEQSGESSSNRSSDDETEMDNDENLNQKLAELRISDVTKSAKTHTSDDVLISKVAHDSSFSPSNLNSRTCATLQEVERNRQHILDKQGSRVLDEERDRVQRLKKRVSDEVRSQWEENRKQQREINCNSIHSIESDEAYSITSSEMPTDTPSSGDENTTASNSTILITTPEIHHYDDSQPEVNANFSAPKNYNSSQNGNDMSEVVRRREKLRSQRPLTRYLPIRQNNFNLKLHIESAGHQLDMCSDNVIISANSCRGYLHKLGNKFRSWKKRWFVFDRSRRALLYFRDKSEAKARRVLYFQDIEQVYVDHQNKVKSPHPGMTFCMKTVERLYFMMAPSPEAMRIWVDVIFTGAEGYQEFMLDMDL